ncbi:hypothetical protein KIPB_004164 [Kipferlia bialata]|uniref:Uncharacterized protein n=1 Tax=Kipferlia bialata TaxID=797122 RepID=A0A9K3GH80_9EUKA|nr:hypothetical protein KIPB_004164 [Kipferlia bialata]|eukprot:g4164.t1
MRFGTLYSSASCGACRVLSRPLAALSSRLFPLTHTVSLPSGYGHMPGSNTNLDMYHEAVSKCLADTSIPQSMLGLPLYVSADRRVCLSGALGLLYPLTSPLSASPLWDSLLVSLSLSVIGCVCTMLLGGSMYLGTLAAGLSGMSLSNALSLCLAPALFACITACICRIGVLTLRLIIGESYFTVAAVAYLFTALVAPLCGVAVPAVLYPPRQRGDRQGMASKGVAPDGTGTRPHLSLLLDTWRVWVPAGVALAHTPPSTLLLALPCLCIAIMLTLMTWGTVHPHTWHPALRVPLLLVLCMGYMLLWVRAVVMGVFSGTSLGH